MPPEEEPAGAAAALEAEELATSAIIRVGLRKAVLIMFIPKAIPAKVGCARKLIRAMTLQSIAKKTPPSGTKTEIAEKISAMIAKAFNLSSGERFERVRASSLALVKNARWQWPAPRQPVR